MKKFYLITMLIVLLTVFMFSVDKVDVKVEKKAITKIITEGYVQGMFTKVDPALLEKHWHKDCDMVGLRNGKMNKRNMGKLLENVKKTGRKPPPRNDVTYKIVFIDVSGTAAISRVEIYFAKKHIYTDYFSFYKFADGWKVATKIWFEHNSPVHNH